MHCKKNRYRYLFLGISFQIPTGIGIGYDTEYRACMRSCHTFGKNHNVVWIKRGRKLTGSISFPETLYISSAIGFRNAIGFVLVGAHASKKSGAIDDTIFMCMSSSGIVYAVLIGTGRHIGLVDGLMNSVETSKRLLGLHVTMRRFGELTISNIFSSCAKIVKFEKYVK